ncbi:MAG TPA: heavy metal-binding domain-containing protein, partial [Pirellulales bacterium]
MRNVKSATRKLLWALRVAQVRLRFLLVLLAAFLIVGKWHVLRNYWETLTTPTTSKFVTGGVNQETEYFCPMCPGVISTWPTKCSVCNMPLVRRQIGSGGQLPDGVLARMQISPDRIQLAGIETAAIDYQPLAREIETNGVVSAPPSGKAEATEFDRKTAGRGHAASSATSAANEVTKIVQAEIHQREIGLVQPGVSVVILPDVELAEPLAGRVLRVFREVTPKSHRVKIEVAAADATDALWPGMEVRLRFRRPMAELEPFCSRPADPPPLVEGALRKLFACAEHPDVLREKRERCPHDHAMLMDLPLTDLERVEWWCPMHPEIVSGERGRTCEQCGGRRLVPRIVQYRPAGEVLAAPTSAVVDLGDRRVAFVERMPGMFDAVEVTIGPRCDGFYPIVSGLQPGQRVAARGAFLLDAETRLNPSVAAGYFGASLSGSVGRPAGPPEARDGPA